MSKPVAKSLHTVTVLVQVARSTITYGVGDKEGALDIAMRTLGLDGRDDPYSLRDAALKQLSR